MTPRTLNYGNYGIFLIMGNAGFCPSAVPPYSLKPLEEAPETGCCADGPWNSVKIGVSQGAFTGCGLGFRVGFSLESLEFVKFGVYGLGVWAYWEHCLREFGSVQFQGIFAKLDVNTL